MGSSLGLNFIPSLTNRSDRILNGKTGSGKGRRFFIDEWIILYKEPGTRLRIFADEQTKL